MDDLSRAVSGEWFDIHEAIDDPYEMEDVFGYTPPQLKSIATDLRGAVEGGVTEYKLSTLLRFFNFLDALKYDSKGFDTLLSQASRIRCMTYVILFQRFVALRMIGQHTSKPHRDAAKDRAAELDLKEIIADINRRIKIDGSLKSNPSVKNILMQIQIYRKELDQMNKLMPNIQKGKLESFKSNYRNTFDEIVGKVRSNYANLTRDEVEAQINEQTDLTPLQRYDLKPLGGILAEQAKEASALHATVAFTVKERYKTREVLTGLMARKNLFLTLIERETAFYRNLEGQHPGPDSLTRAFTSELGRALTRQAERGV